MIILIILKNIRKVKYQLNQNSLIKSIRRIFLMKIINMLLMFLKHLNTIIY